MKSKPRGCKQGKGRRWQEFFLKKTEENNKLKPKEYIGYKSQTALQAQTPSI
jgi:hypothetical protein